MEVKQNRSDMSRSFSAC